MRHAQQHRAAHRMRQRKVRRWTIRHHHLLDKRLNVDFVVGEIPHVALAPVAQLMLRMPLPAPVDDCHRKTAVAQVPHGLEIFFDLLATPGEHADRALASRRRRPARKAQVDPVGSPDGAADIVFRRGIGGNRDKRHDRTVGLKPLKTRARTSKAGVSRPLERVWSPPISPLCRPLPVLPCGSSGCTQTKARPDWRAG